MKGQGALALPKDDPMQSEECMPEEFAEVPTVVPETTAMPALALLPIAGLHAAAERPATQAEDLLKKLQSVRYQSSRGAEPSVLPAFLVPDLNQSVYTNEKLKQISSKRDVAVEIAYKRHQDSIRDEQARLAYQHKSISNRLKQSDVAYRLKRTQNQDDQAQYLETLLDQAKAKKDADQREHYNRRTMRDPDPAKVMPQEGDKDWTKHETIKHSLRRTLDRQVNLRKQRKETEKRVDVAEQRFFLDCVQKQLMDDRRKRRDIKIKQNSMLQDEWRKQKDLNAVKNQYLKKLYGW